MVVAALYLALLALQPGAGHVMRWAEAGFLLLAAAGLAREAPGPTWRAATFWPALHLALQASGGLASPLLPLAGGWVAALGWTSAAAGGVGALLAAALLAGPALAAGAAPPPATLLQLVVLLAVGAVLPWAARRTAAARAPARHPSAAGQASGTGSPTLQLHAESGEEQVLALACELIRRATDAQEAALWEADAEATRARRLAWASGGAAEPPPPETSLAGHPFGWSIVEGVHVRVERGRQPLPTPWAAEMLLVPVDLPRGLLALAYPGVVPPGAEAAAHAASGHLRELASLLALRREKQRTDTRLAALVQALQTLPGEVQLGRFGTVLADAVLASTGAAGAAVAEWDAEAGRGRLLSVRGAGAEGVLTGREIIDGESRMALAVKHGVLLAYADLRAEREPLPLCVPGERWATPPRSAVAAPLLAAGRAAGVLVAWHPLPDHFGEQEEEFLRLLASVAAQPLQGARQYDVMDRRASTDALTGLPNRRTFDARLSAAASHFERYARPFALIVIDVDHFKRFNDTWGHEAGDRVLQHVAQLLQGTLREVDLPARLGGEEFVVLLPETPLAEAAEAAERLRRTLEARAVVWNGRPLHVTASFGVAACPDSGVAPGALLAAADTALYASKEAGRNRVTSAPCPEQAGA